MAVAFLIFFLGISVVLSILLIIEVGRSEEFHAQRDVVAGLYMEDQKTIRDLQIENVMLREEVIEAQADLVDTLEKLTQAQS